MVNETQIANLIKRVRKLDNENKRLKNVSTRNAKLHKIVEEKEEEFDELFDKYKELAEEHSKCTDQFSDFVLAVQHMINETTMRGYLHHLMQEEREQVLKWHFNIREIATNYDEWVKQQNGDTPEERALNNYCCDDPECIHRVMMSQSIKD